MIKINNDIGLITCPMCNGNGYLNLGSPFPWKCENCKGKGEVSVSPMKKQSDE